VFATGYTSHSWGLDDFRADPHERHDFADPRLLRFTNNSFKAMLGQ